MLQTSTSTRKRTSPSGDPGSIKHTQLGVWDLYEESDKRTTYLQQWTKSLTRSYLEFVQALPYLLRMVKDIKNIPTCLNLLFFYLLTRLLLSLLPAVQLWCSGQLLTIVQTALSERSVDKHFLLGTAAGRLLCSISSRLLTTFLKLIDEPLNKRIKRFYSKHYFHALARLDLPTFEDTAVQQQFEEALPRSTKSSVPWDTITAISNTCFKAVTLISEFVILASVLRDQRDGYLLACITFAHSILHWTPHKYYVSNASVWAATTKDSDYIRTEGLKRAVNDPTHRKEIVAGGMWKYMLAQYSQGIERIADRAGDFFEVLNVRRTWAKLSVLNIFLLDPLRELPQIIFTLRAIQYPASIPVSLASLNLITQTTTSFSHALLTLVDHSDSLVDRLTGIRKLYEITELPNIVADGNLPFPENQRSLELGIAIEFRNVSFKYPDTDTYVLHNVSFKVEKGQLCVLVGSNGSGKSTILKLISRLYDVSEGQILVDGVDIKALRLEDLRRSMSVLFQDFTIFPLSIRDNIALGDPDHADDDEEILEAARLGGAGDIVDGLPEGIDTYLERPVKDHYSGLREGTLTFTGRPVSYANIRRRAGMDSILTKSLSGGQMQRIALSRTFMRSSISKQRVGLLLFDEPSASLDPTAEHDLFQRLRQLRGHKTMIFSSHRFGNLTRHADIILYINDSVIVEAGTHEQLLRKGGDYAHIWKLQAQAFV
ncbi:hypothetical protein M378DRAFT_156053 [Amanita muscaria Koide BX008]|uniref:ABC transporter domain-containing protein n=1 Tax=Amanita muscaria (strain Koide BX008) TaxID=946122 RepID=A0A0C2X9P9_AMAMK|nr:hypothetical protein M378DRAFT_156053 [Amanita muscaria Koide BX008]